MKKLIKGIIVLILAATLPVACATKKVVVPTPVEVELPVVAMAAGGNPILQIDTGGHKAIIKDIFFTNDGRFLISASKDKTVRVWDVKTGETMRIIRGHIGEGQEGKIYAAALSPDNRLLALGCWMGPTTNYNRSDVATIRLIDFRTGDITRLLKGHNNVIVSLAFSADGRRLISGSHDDDARIWNVKTGACLQTLSGHKDDIYAVAFHLDGDMAVTGSLDKSLKLWRVSDGEPVATLEGHEDKVRSVAFTPDGKYILSGSWDKTIRLWNGKTGKFIKTLARQNRNVVSLTITLDGKYVLIGIGSIGSSWNCNVFATPSGDRISRFDKHESIVLATAISPDGSLGATGGGAKQEIWP